MKRTVESVDVAGKRVLLRADFNFPVDNGVIKDDTRIKATMPTINHLLLRGARLIICSHLGRPKGVDPNCSLAPAASYLSRALGKPVIMASNCCGPEVEREVATLQPGNALMLENLRFHPEEEANDPEFSRQLAKLADIYVNDAFGTAHRAHASTYGVPQLVRPAVAGFLMIKELRYLGETVKNPKRPFSVVFGGAKVSDKMQAIYNLMENADCVIIGGGMAYTFLSSKGFSIGLSLFQPEFKDKCQEFLETTQKKLGKKVLLPLDHVVTDNLKNPTKIEITVDENIPNDMMGVDIGPRTMSYFSNELSRCNTVLWNGPLGVFENDQFSKGTRCVMEAIAGKVPITVIGGGDSASAAAKFGLTNLFTHVSTGGGASLEFLEGKQLPGVAVLDDVV